MSEFEVGDIAIVTSEKGRRFVAIYSHALGIDYFWSPVLPGTAPSALADPDASAEVIGHVMS